MNTDELQNYIDFWVYVYETFYPKFDFPADEVILIDSKALSHYPVAHLMSSVVSYRNTENGKYPPAARDLLITLDPLLTKEGKEDFAETLYNKVFEIRRNNDTSILSVFEDAVLSKMVGHYHSIIQTTYKPHALKSIKTALESIRNPQRFERLAAPACPAPVVEKKFVKDTKLNHLSAFPLKNLME